jgi:hypothetical protein
MGYIGDKDMEKSDRAVAHEEEILPRRSAKGLRWLPEANSPPSFSF